MALRRVLLEDGAPTDGYPFDLVVATHSPLLMAFPDARVYELAEDVLIERAFDDLEVVSLWRGFLAAPQRFLRHLGGAGDAGEG